MRRVGVLASTMGLLGCMASAPCPTPASSASPASSQSAWTLVEEAAHSLGESRDLVELSRFAALVAETRLHAPEPTTLAPRTRELRQRLVEAGTLRVRELDAVALAATAHEPALRAWHQASFYLSLLPVAESAEEMTAFQQLVEAHERVRLAIERAARLRYSQWALGEIEQFQRQYADATGADDDEENIIRAAARELGPIDAELLLPAIGMLYQQVLSTAAQRLSDEDADLRRLLTAVAVTPKRGLE